MAKINTFDIEIQIDEIASLGEGSDWVNDIEEEDDEFCDD